MRRAEEVLVFVRRGDEFLVLRRAADRGGYWHSVAGALEPDESYADAAARELHEETGLEATPVDVGRPFTYPMREESEWRRRLQPGVDEIAVRAFVVEAPAGWEPTLDWEHDEYRWCPVDEAVELLYWPDVKELLRAVAG